MNSTEFSTSITSILAQRVTVALIVVTIITNTEFLLNTAQSCPTRHYVLMISSCDRLFVCTFPAYLKTYTLQAVIVYYC